MLKLTVTAILSATLAGYAIHRVDAYIVSSVLQSDDTSIIRNVEQANALLDVYEIHANAHGIPSAVDIQRDADGREIDNVPFSGEAIAERLNW